jgi:phosphatidylinositol dimannoside acyltransferase
VRLFDPARAFLWGWRLSTKVPEIVTRGVMRVGADVACLLRTNGVRQLEANIRRARPGASPRQLRRLTREGMRNYLRYYAEAFNLPRLTPEQLDARVRPVGVATAMAEAGEGRAVVLALAHQGNWDLAGAWATMHIAPATTVAERLEPPELFDEFVKLRADLRVRVIPLDRGADVFRQLIRIVQAGNALIPLLSDRDLTSRGVEVTLLGERARVAAGPAALAVAAGTMVLPTTLRHERLHGARRRAAGSRWGMVVTFGPPLVVPPGIPRSEQVQRLTQEWVDVLSADITAHPTHWHMLQKVFVADLDPGRLADRAGEHQ